MNLHGGEKLGPYEIVARLGAGGMGVVYQARDGRLEREVAIKVLPAGVLADGRERSRFRREALALAKLSHPNIAAVYDVGEHAGLDYIVMECVAGASLTEKLKAGPLKMKEAIGLAAEIAEALEEAHERGVVHRDLKPGNIMVTPKGHAKVLDFGLAKTLAPAQSADATLSFAETHGAVGTPLYMSPEQARGEPVDARTDLWGLGVVLYEMLAGVAPFEASSGARLFRAVTEEDPKPLREVRPEVSAEAAQIVARAMEKSPAGRYQTATEMCRDLRQLLLKLSSQEVASEKHHGKIVRAYALGALLAIAAIAAGGMWLYQGMQRRQWAKEEAPAEIARLRTADHPLAALELLEKAQRYAPKDGQLMELANAGMRSVGVTSSPNGATVEVQDYLAPQSAWRTLGTTPLQIKIPDGYFRWRLTKPGMPEYLAAPLTDDKMDFALDKAAAAPDRMVWLPAQTFGDYVGFVGWVGPYQMPAAYLDKFEVSNREYQEFVDAGGYAKPEYWREKFLEDGKELNWSEAMTRFRDSTGRAGPATWEGGHYPEGQAQYPVSGVSWFEASAYAAFRGKSLPVFAQWFEAAPADAARYTVQESNIARAGMAAVGTYQGLGAYGTYDMAGNAKEWVANTVGPNLRLLLGGGSRSQTYVYLDPEALSPFDRSAMNGFRCAKNTEPVPAEAAATVKQQVRDYSKTKPVSDEVFRAYQTMYGYEKTPLNAKVESVVQDTKDWTVQKVGYDAAYGGERIPAYLFLPKNVRPPYQTIVFFPSARVLDIADSRTLGDVRFFDYVVQSGRAVLYPVYQDTYERRVHYTLPGESDGREIVVLRYKDVSRSVDYLATRNDIDNTKLGYLGVSMGAAEGVIYTALLGERLKTAVFLDGGFFISPPTPGRDQADFAPRIKIPVLMVNGKYDFSFSPDKAQLPLFRMLATPEADKKRVLMETPHDVTADKPALVKEVLAWLDKYLGRVE